MTQGLKELKVNARDLELWKTPQTLAVGGREGTLNAQTRCRESLLFCFVLFSWFLLDPITWGLYAGSKEGHLGIQIRRKWHLPLVSGTVLSRGQCKDCPSSLSRQPWAHMQKEVEGNRK